MITEYVRLRVAATYTCARCGAHAAASEPTPEAVVRGKQWEIPAGWYDLRHNRASHQTAAWMSPNRAFCGLLCAATTLLDEELETRHAAKRKEAPLDDLPF